MAHSTGTLWALRVTGFILGFVAACALIVLLFMALSALSGRSLQPRGLGWIVAPFVVGTAGAVLLTSLRTERLQDFFGAPQGVRLWIVGIVSWILVVTAFVFVAEPYGSYISTAEWHAILRWLFVPPVVVAVVYGMFRWATSPKRSTSLPIPTQASRSDAPEAMRSTTVLPQPPPEQPTRERRGRGGLEVNEWLRKRGDGNNMTQLVKAAAEGHNKAAIRSALSTLGATIRGEDDIDYVASASSVLVRELVRSANHSLRDRDTEFVAAVFCIIAANHFAFVVGAEFEMSGAMALLHLTDSVEDQQRLMEPAINTFNDMTINSPKQVQAVGNTLAQWVQSPTPDRWKRLVELFSLFRSNLAAS